MNLTYNIIYEELKQSLDCKLYGSNLGVEPFGNFQIYEKGMRLENSCFYIVTSTPYDLPAYADKILFILCEEAVNDVTLRLMEHYSYIGFSEEQPVWKVVNIVLNAVHKFTDWRDDFDNEIRKPGSLDNVLAHTFPLLGNTLLLVDADLRIISIYSSQEGIVDIAKADLKEDLMAQARQEYLQTRNEREVFYRHIEGDCPRLIYNLFDEGEFVGILSLQEDAVPIRPCDADILKLLGDYVAKIFRHLGSKYSPHINRLSSVVSYLLHNNINPDNLRKSVHHAADYAGIGKEEEFLALVIHKPEDQADRYLPFFMHSLSVRVPGLVLETNELEDSVFILRYSLARSLGIDVEQTIEDYLQEFDFSAGISELYPDLADTRFYYRQAKIALMMAVSTDLKHVNAFSQYYANYLMNRLTSDMPPRVLYSRSFRNILELDKESTISYLETLRAFMKNHLSMTKTANALYISRNALLYRMEKIQTLMKECGEDLTNDVDYLRILTSFLMYDRYSESVNTADLH
ncbi:MAG: helix-turn-helix domain-containing protein [Mogibacterium sp.]|nr:helix-turn-helix domain-containing protein [Mogibacterium sp.]